MTKHLTPDSIAQSVVSLTADPGIKSLISARFHTLVEIDPEIMSTTILLRKVAVSYKRKYVHELSQACPGKSVVR